MQVDRERWLSVLATALGLGASACRGEIPHAETGEVAAQETRAVDAASAGRVEVDSPPVDASTESASPADASSIEEAASATVNAAPAPSLVPLSWFTSRRASIPVEPIPQPSLSQLRSQANCGGLPYREPAQIIDTDVGFIARPSLRGVEAGRARQQANQFRGRAQACVDSSARSKPLPPTLSFAVHLRSPGGGARVEASVTTGALTESGIACIALAAATLFGNDASPVALVVPFAVRARTR